MPEIEMTMEEQIGIYVILTAHGMSVVDSKSSIDVLNGNIREAANWFRDRSYNLSMLMHDDPLYNAARIRGNDPRAYDELGDAVWSKCFTYQDRIFEHLSNQNSAEFRRTAKSIASFVLFDDRELHVDFDYLTRNENLDLNY